MIKNKNKLNDLKQDCTFFKYDRPCIYHKKEGVFCLNCPYYKKINEKIVIIKLEAKGDVLRTTFILPLLRDKYPNAQIIWIVKGHSSPILKNNPFVDKIWVTDNGMLPILLSQQFFDAVYNLDLSEESLILASTIKAKEKYGFELVRNKLVGLNEGAAYLLSTSMSDELKRNNKKTYPQMIAEICELNYKQNRPILKVTKDALNFAEKFRDKHAFKPKQYFVGLNVGSGSRWKNKRWDIENWLALASLLKEKDFNIIFFLGQEEADLQTYIEAKGHISIGANNTLENLFGKINIVDCMITGDTLVLHASLALKKKTIALFGPTSSNEIEMYEDGFKLTPTNNCTICYNTDCSKNCINTISVQKVFETFLVLMKEK